MLLERENHIVWGVMIRPLPKHVRRVNSVLQQMQKEFLTRILIGMQVRAALNVYPVVNQCLISNLFTKIKMFFVLVIVQENRIVIMVEIVLLMDNTVFEIYKKYFIFGLLLHFLFYIYDF